MKKQNIIYQLCYHTFKNFTTGKVAQGRGEYVRLIFQDAKVPYEDTTPPQMYSKICNAFCKSEKNPLIQSTNFQHYELANNQVFGPPFIRVKDAQTKKVVFTLSQTAAILQYLGKKFGYYPNNCSIEEQALLTQINCDFTDFVASGRAPFHTVFPFGSYNDQKNDPRVIQAIADFCKPETGRLFKFLRHFEALLVANQERLKFEKKQYDQLYFVGNSITYIDFHGYQALAAARAQFPGCLQNYPYLTAFAEMIEKRPNIAEYLKSDRRRDFGGDSMM